MLLFSFSEFSETITTGLETLWTFLTFVVDFFPTIISFLPNPFRSITIVFLVIISLMFLIGIVRGDT